MKYFSIERIKQASRHLENFHSGWVIVPFVLAANGVDSKHLTDLSANLGTDALLDRYFSGALIGLTEYGASNSLRPRFKEIMATFRKEAPNDYAINQRTKLWANAYSSRGYREMMNRGELEIDNSSFKLTNKFQSVFEDKLPDTFRFEEFMVWLFAFSGVPDDISTWDELFAHLKLELKVPGGAFAAEFQGRFKTSKTVPWPTDFLAARPTDSEFQLELHPTRVAKTSSAPAPAALQATDPILLHVKNAIEDKGECNFLFYGPPGTGKTTYAHKIADVLTNGDKKRIARLQFHPSLSYDDFIEGYSPAISPTAGVLYYSLSDRHFLEFCREAAKDRDKIFVVVIDEISRGDPSRIFGDFLTYIDKDFRDEEFRLSYSQKPISVPANLIIIGTTNPYDRSVTELDDAFLRRFHMMEFKPDAEFLRKHFSEAGLEGGYADKVLHMFSELNRLMPHGFGHAHFMRVEGPQQFAVEWRAKFRFLIARTFQFDPDKLSEIDGLFDELFVPKEDGSSNAGGAPAAT